MIVSLFNGRPLPEFWHSKNSLSNRQNRQEMSGCEKSYPQGWKLLADEFSTG
jgi:hypothetical protein